MGFKFLLAVVYMCSVVICLASGTVLLLLALRGLMFWCLLVIMFLSCFSVFVVVAIVEKIDKVVRGNEQ